MPFSSYDPAYADLLYCAFDAAMLDLAGTAALSIARRSATIAQITKQLLVAAGNGERDPERLKLLALKGIDRT